MTSPDESTSEVAPEDVTEKKHRGRRFLRGLGEWVLILSLAMFAAMFIRKFVFQTFYIPSVSMVPTLEVGDRIIVSKVSTSLGTIHRGDIIVFARPPRESCGGGSDVTDLVKRVIGLPGETISSRGNTIFINGKALRQHWETTAPLGREIGTVKIPKGQYFMMGDNRSASCDSRYWGTLPKRYVVGKVILRIWPLSHLGQP